MFKRLLSWVVSAALLGGCLWGLPIPSCAEDGTASPAEVNAMIEALFPVTHKTAVPLKEAVQAYEALSPEEQAQVTSYSRIAEAEAQLQALHDAFSVSVSGWPASLDSSTTSWMGKCTTEEKALTRQAMAEEIRRLYVEEGYQAGETEDLALVDTWAPTWTPAGVLINLDAADSDNIGKIHGENWGFNKIGTIISAPYAGMAFSQIRYMSQDYVADGWTPLLSNTFLYDGRYYSVTWDKVKSYDSGIPEERGRVLTAEELTYTDQYPGKGLINDGNNTFRYALARYNQTHKSDGRVLGIPIANARLTDGVAYQTFSGPDGDAYIAGDPVAITAAADTPEKPEGAYAIAGEMARAFQSLGETDNARFAVTGAPLGEQYEAEGMLCQDFQLLTLAVDPETGAVTQTSNDTALRDFSIEGGQLLDNLGTGINILVPAGTDITQITPDFSIHPHSTVTPAKGPQDFTDAVTYTVTSQLGVSESYVVTVIVDGPGSPADTAAAEQVRQAIGHLPAEISLQETAQVQLVQKQYDALSPRQKYLVDNVAKLEDALEQAETLSQGKIKVACIGDSITEGDVSGGVVQPASYPSQLQEMLGDRYEIRNFGKCGICMSKNSHYPYWGLSEFTESQAYQPDIVIIMLGTNDASTRNWSTVQGNFESDYTEFVNIYKNLESKPQIYLTKVSGVHQAAQIGIEEVNEIVERIAENTGSQLADMYTWEYNLSDSDKAKYFDDSLHPNAEGYTLMARQFKQQIFEPLEDSTLKSIEIDGRPLEGFQPDQTEYTLEIGRDDPLPVVTAVTNAEAAAVHITQAQEDYPVATLNISAGNPYFSRAYTITLKRAGGESVLEQALAAAEEALDGLHPTNETTADEVLDTAVKAVNHAQVAISWKEPFTIKMATADTAGSITGILEFSFEGRSLVLQLEFSIEPLGGTGILAGDMDEDGEVTITDIMEACRVLARKAADIVPTPDEIAIGDLNTDGDMTIIDVMMICRILARKN